jgi:hypothetical protein
MVGRSFSAEWEGCTLPTEMSTCQAQPYEEVIGLGRCPTAVDRPSGHRPVKLLQPLAKPVAVFGEVALQLGDGLLRVRHLGQQPLHPFN